MPDIQIDGNEQFQDIIDATFLFIDSVTEGFGVYVEIFYEGGHSEKQEIVTGSKFLQSEDGQKIQKVKFVNPGWPTEIADVSYRYSTIFGYDEARVVGVVTADIKKSTTIESYTDYTLFPGSTWGFGSGPDVRKTYYTNVSNTVVRWGDVAIAVPNSGGVLYPGQTIELETTAPVYMYNPGTENAIISRVAIKD